MTARTETERCKKMAEQMENAAECAERRAAEYREGAAHWRRRAAESTARTEAEALAEAGWREGHAPEGTRAERLKYRSAEARPGIALDREKARTEVAAIVQEHSNAVIDQRFGKPGGWADRILAVFDKCLTPAPAQVMDFKQARNVLVHFFGGAHPSLDDAVDWLRQCAAPAPAAQVLDREKARELVYQMVMGLLSANRTEVELDGLVEMTLAALDGCLTPAPDAMAEYAEQYRLGFEAGQKAGPWPPASSGEHWLGSACLACGSTRTWVDDDGVARCAKCGQDPTTPAFAATLPNRDALMAVLHDYGMFRTGLDEAADRILALPTKLEARIVELEGELDEAYSEGNVAKLALGRRQKRYDDAEARIAAVRAIVDRYPKRYTKVRAALRGSDD